MKTTLTLLFVGAAAQLLAADFVPDDQAANIRYALDTSASEMGWGFSDVQDEKKQERYGFIRTDPNGALSVTLYPDTTVGDTAWAKLNFGEPTTFEGHPARIGASSAQMPMARFAWRQSGMIAYVAVNAGDAKSAASCLYTNLAESLTPLPIPPSEAVTEDSPKIATTTSTASPVRKDSIKIAELSVSRKAIKGQIKASEAIPASIVVAECISVASGKVVQKHPLLLQEGATVTLTFHAPVLGWEDGRYEIRLVADGQDLAIRRLQIKEGALINE